MASNYHQNIVTSWLSSFSSALSSRDIPGAVELFQDEECIWRDLLSFTWNIYTAESQDEIQAMLEATLDMAKPSNWKIQGEVETTSDGVLECFITFETKQARGKGRLKLRKSKCWCLLTSMVELKGFEEKAGFRRENGAQHGIIKGRITWKEARDKENEELGICKQPYCLIVGGGHAGIMLAARLRRLGVPTIIVDKNERPGDSWRNRYKSLYLHDPVWTHHMPYLPFPDHWPIFPSKDKIADWIEAYTCIMELVYWTSTECKSASYDANTETWKVLLDKNGREVAVYPKQLVLATGNSRFPNIPDYPGSERFQGVQYHSNMYYSGKDWTGKHCVIIGSGNSAHDICPDLWENGAMQITMVQRSPTTVLRRESMLSLRLLGNYYEGSKYSTEDADLIFTSVPYKHLHKVLIPLYKKVQEVDADFYERLKSSGFMVDFGEDGSGVFMKYLRRGSGYCIDVGASELIINGDVKLKSGVTVSEIRPRSVVFSDGSEVEADLIVYATGFSSFNAWTAKLISQEVADKIGKCWGLGSNTKKDPGPWERELRNMWKPTQQSGLWFHAGNLLQSRQYSLYLALQLKARMEGIPFTVHGMSKVHHTRD